MRWYNPSKKSVLAASNPPAYIMERISDLRYACDISSKSPSEAKTVIMEVARQLSAHHDKAFSDSLTLAADRMLDSPAQATKGVQKVILVMLSEREEHEAEMEMKKRVKRP